MRRAESLGVGFGRRLRHGQPVGSTGAFGCDWRRGWTGWTKWTQWTKRPLVRRETLTGNTEASSCHTSTPVHKVHHCPFCPSFRCRSQSSSNRLSDKMPLGAASRGSWYRLLAQITALSPPVAAKRPQTTPPQFDHGRCIARQGRSQIEAASREWTCVHDRRRQCNLTRDCPRDAAARLLLKNRSYSLLREGGQYGIFFSCVQR